jgi:peptidyl-prolyl cis-trans isomerase C
MALLKKGEITSKPVQTRQGWNVIQLLDTRDRTPPAYDAVKARLGERVLANKLTKRSDEMLKAAKVDPPLTTVPAASAASAPPSGAAPPAPAPAEAPKTN